MALQHSPRIITDGLVLCLDAANKLSYPGSGTVWTDLAGSNNGTLTNGPTFNSANGGSIVFDGVNDYVSIGTLSNLVGLNGVTVDTWFYNYTTLSSYQSIIGQYNGSSGWLIHTSTNTNYKIVVLVGDGSSFGGINDIPTNAWFNVILSYNGTLTGDLNRLKMYVNGVYRSFDSYSGGAVPSTWPNSTSVNANIGALLPSLGRYFNGLIPSVKIYNRALSAQEVLQNYNALKSRYNL